MKGGTHCSGRCFGSCTGAVLLLAMGTMACGPFFPSGLLNRGDEVLLSTPTANFKEQLGLMKLVPSKFPAVPPTDGNYFQQSLDADLADLRSALGPDRESVVTQYEAARKQLQSYMNWRDRPRRSSYNIEEEIKEEELENKVSAPGPVVGLPEEFDLYWNGLVAFRKGEADEAHGIWNQLLELPPDKRKFRTVWANFMLGRAAGTDREESISYYRETRNAVEAGFHDGLGLAQASLGWEARAEKESDRFVPAFHLYAEQWASGEPSALGSMQLIADDLLNSETALEEVAADSLGQRVMTAYILSRGGLNEREMTRLKLWLAAVESADVKNVAEGERLALAAYKTGDMELATRWIARAPKSSPVTQWVQAKLFLRDGKLDKAAASMAKIATSFPKSGSTNELEKFEETLSGINERSADSQARGELATLQLARREFVQALNTLMDAGTTYWSDAAYMAERVLTLDELKNYVDSHPAAHVDNEEATAEQKDLEEAGKKLRYLLARKLTRAERMEEAWAYFPTERQQAMNTLTEALKTSRDLNQSLETRANAYWNAAVMVRTNGMELMGTELEPDFFINAGEYELGGIVAQRSSSQTNVAHASEAELERATKLMANPNKRFHYRYLAAGLAWQAAKMMPNNDEQTAQVLCQGGSWIKAKDPQLADLFYKALVRRCRKLPIGQEADRLRWFPDLDAEGKFVPRSSVAPPEDPLPNVELEAQL